MSKILNTIFFDLDGTLWDETKLIEKIRESIDKDLFKLLPELINQEIKLKGFYTWTNVYNKIGINYCDLIKKYSSYIHPYPEVIKTLSLLQNTYSLWIVSDAGKDYTQLKLKILGLKDFFDGIITSDQTFTMKSNKAWWIEAIKISKKNKENILVIGDSKNDILPTSELGIPSIYIGSLKSLSFSLPKKSIHCSSFSNILLKLKDTPLI